MQRREFMGFAGGTLAMSVAGIEVASTPAATRDAREGDAAATTTDAAAWRDARRYAKTTFGEIAYVERGDGPAALFLHGFPLNGFQWRGALDRLSAHRRCVAPDFLGLGYTRVAEGQSVAPEAQAEMLAALLDTLAIDSVDLVANDSGGAVAQLFLARFPQRVRSVLLTNCDTEHDCPPPALQPVLQLAREGKFVGQWLAPWLADKALARSAEGLGGMTFTFRNQPSDEAIDMYLAPLVSSPHTTHAYAVGLERNFLVGIEADLKRCTAPTRIVWGTGDDIFSAESPQYLSGAFGNSQGIRRVENAKLFFPEEFPDVIAEEARKLWAVA